MWREEIAYFSTGMLLKLLHSSIRLIATSSLSSIQTIAITTTWMITSTTKYYKQGAQQQQQQAY